MSLSFLSGAANDASWLLLVSVLGFSGGTSTRDGSVSTIATSVPSHDVCVAAGQAHKMAIRTGTAGGQLTYVVAWSCHHIPKESKSPILMLLTTSGFDGTTSPRDGSSASISLKLPENDVCNQIGNAHRQSVYQAISGGDTTYAVSWSCTPLLKDYSISNSPLRPENRSGK